MAEQYASDRKAISICDRCGFQYPLRMLRKEVLKQRPYNIKVCPECYEKDQPQLSLGTFPVNDPQALRDPRPDTTYVTSGLGPDGYPAIGQLDIQWGWNPIGGSSAFDADLTPNNLVMFTTIGSVTFDAEPVQCTGMGSTAIPGWAIPGCSIPGVETPSF